MSGPSRIAEAIVAVFLPPACREEVLGDLHERRQSPVQYALDALRTVPLVIVSRIRRTADPEVLLMQAFALYVSFLGAARLKDGGLLTGQWGLLRLAIPPAMAMLGLILEDAYAKPGPRPALTLARGPALGIGFAIASQSLFHINHPDLELPRVILFYGCAAGLLLSTAVRLLFPPATGQLQSANAPAHWLKRSGFPPGSPEISIRAAKSVAVICGIWVAGSWIANQAVLPKPRVVTLLVVLVIAYQAWKRV